MDKNQTLNTIWSAHIALLEHDNEVMIAQIKSNNEMIKTNEQKINKLKKLLKLS